MKMVQMVPGMMLITMTTTKTIKHINVLFIFYMLLVDFFLIRIDATKEIIKQCQYNTVMNDNNL